MVLVSRQGGKMRGLTFLLLLSFIVSSCAFVQKEAERIIVDSDYAQYNQKKDEIEKAYINGEITYSEYHAKMKEIQQERLKAEHQREEILFK